MADHVARSVGCLAGQWAQLHQQFPQQVLASVPSGGLDDVGVVQQVVAGDLLNFFAGADHYAGEPGFSVMLLPRQCCLVAG